MALGFKIDSEPSPCLFSCRVPDIEIDEAGKTPTVKNVVTARMKLSVCIKIISFARLLVRACLGRNSLNGHPINSFGIKR